MVNLDWLCVSFTRVDPLEEGVSGRIGISDTGTRAAQWDHIYNVTYDDEYIGQLVTDNRINACANLVQFKFENSILYTHSDKITMLQAVADALKLNLIGISRVDLAGDYDPSEKLTCYYLDTQRFCRGLATGHVLRAKLYKKAYVMPRLQNGKFSYCAFGKTGTCAVLYNKSAELEVSQKVHIWKKWKNAGLPEGEIWRFEIRLNGWSSTNARKCFRGVDLKKDLSWIDNPEFITALYFAICDNNFKFVIKGHESCLFGRRSVEKCTNRPAEDYERELVDVVKFNNFTKGCSNYLTKLCTDTDVKRFMPAAELHDLEAASCAFDRLQYRVSQLRNRSKINNNLTEQASNLLKNERKCDPIFTPVSVK